MGNFKENPAHVCCVIGLERAIYVITPNPTQSNTHTHTHIHTYIHTFTHIHTHTQRKRKKERKKERKLVVNGSQPFVSLTEHFKFSFPSPPYSGTAFLKVSGRM